MDFKFNLHIMVTAESIVAFITTKEDAMEAFAVAFVEAAEQCMGLLQAIDITYRH